MTAAGASGVWRRRAIGNNVTMLRSLCVKETVEKDWMTSRKQYYQYYIVQDSIRIRIRSISISVSQYVMWLWLWLYESSAKVFKAGCTAKCSTTPSACWEPCSCLTMIETRRKVTSLTTLTDVCQCHGHNQHADSGFRLHKLFPGVSTGMSNTAEASKYIANFAQPKRVAWILGSADLFSPHSRRCYGRKAMMRQLTADSASWTLWT